MSSKAHLFFAYTHCTYPAASNISHHLVKKTQMKNKRCIKTGDNRENYFTV